MCTTNTSSTNDRGASSVDLCDQGTRGRMVVVEEGLLTHSVMFRRGWSNKWSYPCSGGVGLCEEVTKKDNARGRVCC